MLHLVTLFAGEYSSVLQIPVRALAYQQVLSLHKAQPNKYKPVVSSGRAKSCGPTVEYVAASMMAYCSTRGVHAACNPAVLCSIAQ